MSRNAAEPFTLSICNNINQSSQGINRATKIIECLRIPINYLFTLQNHLVKYGLSNNAGRQNLFIRFCLFTCGSQSVGSKLCYKIVNIPPGVYCLNLVEVNKVVSQNLTLQEGGPLNKVKIIFH